MKDLSKLYAHLPYFEQTAGQEPRRLIKEAGVFYVEYEQDMNDFLDAYYAAEWTDTAYPDTLAGAGITSPADMEAAISGADRPLLKAMLTQMVREERFGTGALARYAGSGLIAGVLRRMKELEDA
ncbi:DUF6508 domain-containing protein [Sporosarcina trichiuri]|nr:DUF6508 domain-containing protein [Sporosarcina sp. 0.2-SM1T-5]WJY26341.1 DUF6508 domain-containing protein [Sporosarcina sp. 0.2-SM1T-5]